MPQFRRLRHAWQRSPRPAPDAQPGVAPPGASSPAPDCFVYTPPQQVRAPYLRRAELAAPAALFVSGDFQLGVSSSRFFANLSAALAAYAGAREGFAHDPAVHVRLCLCGLAGRQPELVQASSVQLRLLLPDMLERALCWLQVLRQVGHHNSQPLEFHLAGMLVHSGATGLSARQRQTWLEDGPPAHPTLLLQLVHDKRRVCDVKQLLDFAPEYWQSGPQQLHDALELAVVRQRYDLIPTLLRAGARAQNDAMRIDLVDLALRHDGCLLDLLFAHGVSPQMEFAEGQGRIDLMQRLFVPDVPAYRVRDGLARLMACGLHWERRPHPDHASCLRRAMDLGDAHLEALLQAGLDVNKIDAYHGYTPLLDAVQLDKPDMMRRLLRAGAHSDAPGADGTTPRQLAQSLARSACVHALDTYLPCYTIAKRLWASEDDAFDNLMGCLACLTPQQRQAVQPFCAALFAEMADALASAQEHNRSAFFADAVELGAGQAPPDVAEALAWMAPMSLLGHKGAVLRQAMRLQPATLRRQIFFQLGRPPFCRLDEWDQFRLLTKVTDAVAKQPAASVQALSLFAALSMRNCGMYDYFALLREFCTYAAVHGEVDSLRVWLRKHAPRQQGPSTFPNAAKAYLDPRTASIRAYVASVCQAAPAAQAGPSRHVPPPLPEAGGALDESQPSELLVQLGQTEMAGQLEQASSPLLAQLQAVFSDELQLAAMSYTAVAQAYARVLERLLGKQQLRSVFPPSGNGTSTLLIKQIIRQFHADKNLAAGDREHFHAITQIFTRVLRLCNDPAVIAPLRDAIWDKA